MRLGKYLGRAAPRRTLRRFEQRQARRLSMARRAPSVGLFDRGMDAVAGAIGSGVGRGVQAEVGRGPGQGADDLALLGAGQVAQMSKQDVGGPDQ